VIIKQISLASALIVVECIDKVLFESYLLDTEACFCFLHMRWLIFGRQRLRQRLYADLIVLCALCVHSVPRPKKSAVATFIWAIRLWRVLRIFVRTRWSHVI